MRRRRLDRDQARRAALSAQGITGGRPAGRTDVRHFRRVVGSTGLLQLDSVNVLERSHYLPVFSRLGPYDRTAFDRWTVASGEMFEYWGHEASLLPVRHHATFRFRMESWKPWRAIRRLLDERPGYVESVLSEVAERGPLGAGDLTEPGERGGPWWGYAPGKHALEWLFATGRVTAFRGRAFRRRYDLPERVLPAEALTGPPVTEHDAYRTLLECAARRHGVATAADLVDYYRLHAPTARPVISELVTDGVLIPVTVDGWHRDAYLHAGATIPRLDRGTALLSPFDPIVWKRDRAERLFSFRYRIEIYVPEDRRIYGYYVLPFLLDGHLVARVDLKSDRKAGKLVIRSAHIEPGRDAGHVAAPLLEETRAMAGWLGLGDVVIEERGSLAGALRRRSRL